MSLKIWGRANSLNVQKVLWCSTELGLEFERIDWAGEFGGNDDPAYRALHPHGKVPTLQDGDVTVWESNTIQRYLCSTRAAGAALYPADPAARAAVESWMDWQLAGLNPSMVALLLGYYRTPEEKRNHAALAASQAQAQDLWRIVDDQLSKRPFLGGTSFTIADIGTGIQAYRWYEYPIERRPLPHLERWLHSLRERRGFQRYVDGPVS
ncbi:MAG: glutathione S-transferase [Hyphomicrobiales bacterium]|nr:MAG: glutathione S-transferase [Hyphomicrobiales bacterium]